MTTSDARAWCDANLPGTLDCWRSDAERAYNAGYASAADAAAADDDADADARGAYDKQLSDFAEMVVKILIEMKAPGCEWLDLTEGPAA